MGLACKVDRLAPIAGLGDDLAGIFRRGEGGARAVKAGACGHLLKSFTKDDIDRLPE